MQKIKFTVVESQELDSDIRVKGEIKYNGELHNVSMCGLVDEVDKIKKRIIKALGRNITMLLEQERRKKDIADIVGITYEEHDVVIERK